MSKPGKTVKKQQAPIKSKAKRQSQTPINQRTVKASKTLPPEKTSPPLPQKIPSSQTAPPRSKTSPLPPKTSSPQKIAIVANAAPQSLPATSQPAKPPSVPAIQEVTTTTKVEPPVTTQSKTATDPLRSQLEALLFSSGRAMEEEQFASLTGADKKAIRTALKTLQQEYAGRDTALKIYDEGTTWKLLVRDEHVPLVRRIVADTELSRATMETLAIIAYHQPKVLQSKVVDLRGGNAYEQIAELERLGFILKEKEGRSFSLRLAEKFFEYFDVEGEKGIRQLFKTIKTPQPKEQQKQLGELPVVDIPPEKKSKSPKGKLLGGLEVIDEPEQTEEATQPSERPTDPSVTVLDAPNMNNDLPPTAKLERNMDEENGFLAKIERQIDELARRNDEIAKDPLFKLPEQPTPPEGLEPNPEQSAHDGPQEARPTMNSQPPPSFPAPEPSPVTSEPPSTTATADKPKRPRTKPSQKNI